MNHIGFGLLVFGACFTAALRPLLAESDVAAKVRALEEKISTQAASEQPERSSSKERTVLQLRLLAAQISRGEYEKAQQSLSSVGTGELPTQLRQEWLHLATQLTSELETLKAAAQTKWRAGVDTLVNDTRNACLEGETSADLDPLLVRAAALQMQRLGQENLLGQRASRKLAGVLGTLESWSNFLDFRAAQNAKAANDILRNLRNNHSQFPVLTVPEIDAHLIPDESEKPSAQVVRIFDGVKTPNDLPTVVERLKNLKIGAESVESQLIPSERQRFESLQDAWELAKKGDHERALGVLQQVPYGGIPEVQRQYDSLREQIIRPILELRIRSFSDLQPAPDENLAAFGARVLDQLHEKGDYASVLEVMKILERFSLSSHRGESLTRDRAVIERYLSAKRFDSVGDALAAVNDYRYVIGAAAGRYSPAKAATEAMAKLKEQSPEAFKSYDGMILEEIRSLRQQIHMLNRGAPGQPFSGPRGR